jgi:hypothetical protein
MMLTHFTFQKGNHIYRPKGQWPGSLMSQNDTPDHHYQLKGGENKNSKHNYKLA